MDRIAQLEWQLSSSQPQLDAAMREIETLKNEIDLKEEQIIELSQLEDEVIAPQNIQSAQSAPMMSTNQQQQQQTMLQTLQIPVQYQYVMAPAHGVAVGHNCNLCVSGGQLYATSKSASQGNLAYMTQSSSRPRSVSARRQRRFSLESNSEDTRRAVEENSEVIQSIRSTLESTLPNQRQGYATTKVIEPARASSTSRVYTNGATTRYSTVEGASSSLFSSAYKMD
ncbi:uncharacterized protein LOC141900594 [Tubulanus polymorphus]|uniref:uncharacterized protein LOC141900594 n=1 Tax=Tubulanus polymorphus TaxID=672921 RepID=UPI003DA6C947